MTAWAGGGQQRWSEERCKIYSGGRTTGPVDGLDMRGVRKREESRDTYLGGSVS